MKWSAKPDINQIPPLNTRDTTRSKLICYYINNSTADNRITQCSVVHLLNHSKHSTFATLALILTLIPLMICLTTTSTFFPLVVTGISGVLSMMTGTCLGLSLWWIVLLTVATNCGVRSAPDDIFTKRTTCSSVSLARRRPTQTASSNWVAKLAWRTLYYAC